MKLTRHRAAPLLAVLFAALTGAALAPQPSAAEPAVPPAAAARTTDAKPADAAPADTAPAAAPAGAGTSTAAKSATAVDAEAARGRYRIRNRLSGKCLVPWGTGDGTAVTQVGCDDGDPANWWFLDTGGVTSIVNQKTNRCLDLWGNGNANGQLVFTWTCRRDGDFSEPQRWRPVNKGGQYWELRGYSTDKCLDLHADNRADGAVIQQWSCNWGANDNQQWWIG